MNYVQFGKYPQKRDGSVLPIEWIILEDLQDRQLLLSRFILDVRAYNRGLFADVTWETCDLRKWLNSGFYSMAFSESEREKIILTKIDNQIVSSTATWETSSGKDTEDKVFLLSLYETEEIYGPEISKNAAYLTGYAASKKNADTKWCWTRTKGKRPDTVVSYGSNGLHGHYFVNNTEGCVRPSLWIMKN